MEDTILSIKNNNINNTDSDTNKIIQIIIRQTDYSEEIAIEKLKEFNYDHIKVIKDFLGITEKKACNIKSVNQEIYRQLRYKLDSSMRDYNIRKENGETKNV